MTAAELLASEVVDVEGRRLGSVHDIRLARCRASGRWHLDAVLVGPSAVSHRLGYATGEVRGPAPLAAVARLLARRTRAIAWADVVARHGSRLVVRPAPPGGGRP